MTEAKSLGRLATPLIRLVTGRKLRPFSRSIALALDRWADRLLASRRGVAPRFCWAHLDVVAHLLGDNAHFLQRFTERFRHLRQRAFAVHRARISGQIVQIRRTKLGVPQPILDHVWCQARQAFLAAKILLSHARCISWWECVW